MGTKKQELGNRKPSPIYTQTWETSSRVEMGHMLSSELRNKCSQKLKSALELQQKNFLLRNNVFYSTKSQQKENGVNKSLSRNFIALVWCRLLAQPQMEKAITKRNTCCPSHLHLQRLLVIASVQSYSGTEGRSVICLVWLIGPSQLE